MTQSICLIQQFNLELNGSLLFEHLNFQLPAQQFSALIASNGRGKSLLMRALHDLGNLTTSTHANVQGSIVWSVEHAYLPQLARIDPQHHSIAEALGIAQLAQCFNRIEQGIGLDDDYEHVDGLWHLPQQWHMSLEEANLPTDLDFQVCKLSEGQKTKLALCRLFQLKDHYLLLDEPSNHLDQSSRHWLIQQINQHPAGCLVISHDRELLHHATQLFVLDSFGIQQHSCNYTDYLQQHQLQVDALERRVQQEKRQVKRLKQQQHETRMKAEKRQQHAAKSRQNSSQAKILLDYQKDQAEQSRSNLQGQLARQMSSAQNNLNQSQQQLEIIKAQHFQLNHNPRSSSGEILRCQQVQLPHISTEDIHFALQAGEKLHLAGANGVGKSSLLRMIDQGVLPAQGEIYLRAKTLYLDQNFSFLDHQLNAVDNLIQAKADISAVDWRRLLGQLGLRGEKTQRPIAELSGGEQLKVALTAISQLSDQIDLLILDEPENHLDIESRMLLAEAIADFPAAVILVSHDPFFVEDCNIDQHYSICFKA